jgi:hypothetical protein
MVEWLQLTISNKGIRRVPLAECILPTKSDPNLS